MDPKTRTIARRKQSLQTHWRWFVLLLVGLLIPFTTANNTVALAAWIVPVLMVRFLRTGGVRHGLVIAGAVHAAAFGFAWRDAYPMPTMLLLGLGLVFFVPYAVDRAAAPRLRGFASTLVLPSAWVTLEFLLTIVPVLDGTPIGTWGSLAYSQDGNLPLLQVASVTGLYGITFLIAWTASIVNYLWERRLTEATIRIGLAFAIFLTSVVAIGVIRLEQATAGDDVVRAAGIVVPHDQVFFQTWSTLVHDTPDEEKARATTAGIRDLHDRLFEQSQAAATRGAKIIAWAEDNAVVFPEDAHALIERGRRFARQHQIALFMGMAVMNPGDLMDNQVVAITPAGEVHSTYLKAIPAPGELSNPGDGVIESQDTAWARVAAAICFDFDFPALIRQAGIADVDLMVNAGDDWAGIDPMHPNMAAMRSIENGFSQIRPTHEARSVAVDPYGRTVASVEASNEPSILLADLPASGVRTIYAQVGDLFAYLALGMLFALCSAAGISALRASRVRLDEVDVAAEPRLGASEGLTAP